jgi:hypothetical protein
MISPRPRAGRNGRDEKLRGSKLKEKDGSRSS